MLMGGQSQAGKAKHKAKYSEKRFRPIRNKNKHKIDETPASNFDDSTTKRKEKTAEEDAMRSPSCYLKARRATSSHR